jgi:hypothetical protein
MAAIPLKREYAPTLGELLAPRWRAARRGTRVAVVVAVLAVCGLVGAVVLTLVDSRYSHGGPVPFHLRYRDLARTTPHSGEYVRLFAGGPHGSLDNAFAVGPLDLPPYTGNLSGFLPVYATGVIAGLRRQYPGFELRAEGEERVDTTNGVYNPNGYEISFSYLRGSEPVDGRVILITSPHSPGRRQGLTVTMLTRANSGVNAAHPVGSAGILNLPFGTLTFAG